jgi:putative MFS transporter
VYFVGIVVGSFASSFFADKIGRKNLMIGSMFATFVCLLITGIVNNYVEMIICRVCLGVLFGLSMPMSYVVISEIVPMHLRGRFIVLL